MIQDQFKIAGPLVHQVVKTEDRHLSQVPVDKTAQAKANPTTMKGRELLTNYQRLLQAQDKVGHQNQVHTHEMLKQNQL
jgi:hypothetical protein